jgi:hypothetical protein
MARWVSLFVTCIVDQLLPSVSIAMAEVLERIGYQVDFPKRRPAADSRLSTAGFGVRHARSLGARFMAKKRN